jgi:excisionase family DNA binding protein
MKPRDNASPSRIMTVVEVAKYLSLHPSTIYRIARKGKIPVFKIGTDYRFDRDVIEKWMNDRHVKLRKN